jgi:hypothetical protein
VADGEADGKCVIVGVAVKIVVAFSDTSAISSVVMFMISFSLVEFIST